MLEAQSCEILRLPGFAGTLCEARLTASIAAHCMGALPWADGVSMLRSWRVGKEQLLPQTMVITGTTGSSRLDY